MGVTELNSNHLIGVYYYCVNGDKLSSFFLTMRYGMRYYLGVHIRIK
jgi:hypothetical protein